MELKSLLFIAGTVLAVGAQAQVGTAQSEPLTAVIQPRLQAVQTKNVMANGTLTTVISRNKVRPVAPILAKSGQENSGKLRLDSIIQTDVYGTGYATRQLFEYNDAGKESKRGIYYWDSVSNSWGEPTETYDYEWNEDGLIVSQQGLSGGQGVRYEYKYNEQGLGIEQLTQQLDESGQWVNVSKGVYGYDDRGNMTDEMVYAWTGGQWVQAVHNVVSYDDKNRQASFEGYEWDGTKWQGTSKADYIWFDGPYPDYEEGTNPDRMTFKEDFNWNGTGWEPYYIFVNEFYEEGYLKGQSEKYWDATCNKWCGQVSDYKYTWRSRKTYDEHWAEILSETWKCQPDSTGWLYVSASPTTWTYDGEGNREGLYEFVSFQFDGEGNKIGELRNQRTYYGYNADNQKTWLLDQVDNGNGWESLFEYKYAYNEQGLQTLSAGWDWVDGKRTPNIMTETTYNTEAQPIEMITKNGGSGLSPLGVPAMRGAAIEPEDEEGWVNSTRVVYTYENGTFVQSHSYRWSNGEWMTNQGQEVIYDFNVTSQDAYFPEGWTDPYKINTIDDLYGDGNNGWLKQRRTYYYSEHIPSGISTVTTVAGGDVAVVYVDDKIEVSAEGNVKINIYSVGGTCVKSSSEKSVYIGDLPSGVYIVTVNGYKTKLAKK